MCKVDTIPGIEIRQDLIGLRRWYYKGQRIAVEWSGGGPPERAWTARLPGMAGAGYGRQEQDAVEDLLRHLSTRGRT